MTSYFRKRALVPSFENETDTQALRHAIELARAAERLGYRRYWAAEHHDLPGLACTAPEVLLAAIGAHTGRIRLGTGALLLPHYKPLKVAEMFHLLAALYPGRIDLGIGRAPGGNAHVSMALSGNFLDNVRRLPESLRDVAALIRGDYEYDGQPVRARPTPSVPPELWLLGTNAKSAAYAAALGMGYVFGQFMSDTSGEDVIRSYRESFVASAFLPAPRAIVAVGVICADTEAEARELAAHVGKLFSSADQPAALPDAATVQIPADRRLIAGTPSVVRRHLIDLASAYGVDELLVATLVPGRAHRLRSYEMLAQAMLPGTDA